MSEKTSKRKLPASFSKQAVTAAQHTAVQPLRLPVGCITYVAAQEDVEQVCQSIVASGVEALGFDVEWHVTYRTGEVPRPIAVIQLALPMGPTAMRCYLLHIACSGITPSLSRILCSPDIRKAGVGIHGDAQKLMRDFGLHSEGLVDLSEEANLRLCHPTSGRLPEKWSLARLAECTLRRSIEKDQTLRTGNWQIWPLSAEQQQYAALDAYASLLIYKHLMALPVPILAPPPLAAEPDQASSQACEPLHMPALSTEAPLQPAKLAVWKLFMDQGMSVQAIADLRRLKLDTVESYLAEAMTAGKAYHWHRLHVPDNVVATVSEHALAQLASAAGGDVSGLCKGGGPQQCTEADPAMPEGPCMYSQISQKCDEDDYLDVCCAQRVPEDQDLENERSKAQIHVSGLGGGDLTSSEASNKEADARDRHIESNCVSGCLNSSATLTAKGAEGSVLGDVTGRSTGSH
ncbi:g6596 [Coccomyxa viridis]|uniref:3'-5' exonuclease n=1 Tax=Coccomyxa viridis TaxID=1274662 RepID=A0ABP1FYB5_9CHLO